MPTNRAYTHTNMTPAIAGANPNVRLQALQDYVQGLSINTVGSPKAAGQALAARFGSFANTIQTRMDTSPSLTSTFGGNLQAQVERAVAQVMRAGALDGAAAGSSPGPGGLDLFRSPVASLVSGARGAPAMSPYQATLLREARIVQADALALIDSLQALSPLSDPGDVTSLQALLKAEVNALLEEFAYARLLPRQQRVRVLLGSMIGWGYTIGSNVLGATGFAGGSVPAVPVLPSDVNDYVRLLNLGGPNIPTVAVEEQIATQAAMANDATLWCSQWASYWTLALQSLWSTGFGPTWSLWETSPSAVPDGTSSAFSTKAPSDSPWPTGGLNLLGPQPPQPASVSGQLGPVAQQTDYWVALVMNSPSRWLGKQSLTERLIRADLLLPVIADDADRVTAALDAIGFSRGEQETTQLSFWSYVDFDLLNLEDPPYVVTTTSPLTISPPGNAGPTKLPYWGSLSPQPPLFYSSYVNTSRSVTNCPIPVYCTVADILDWARTITTSSAMDQIRTAGALGLDLICEQAEELFWLVLSMLDQSVTATQLPELGDAQVQIELVATLYDLDQLASLAM